jgi:PAS domain S-box-containing protein
VAIVEAVIQQSRSQTDKRAFGVEMVSILDDNGVGLYISPEHETALGRPPHKLVGTCMFDLIHPSDVNHVSKRFHHMAETKMSTSVDFRFQHICGRWIEIRAEGTPLIENELLRGYLIVSNTRIAIDLEKLKLYISNRHLKKL